MGSTPNLKVRWSHILKMPLKGVNDVVPCATFLFVSWFGGLLEERLPCCDSLWLPTTTNDYQWLPMTTNDYQLLPMITNDYQWLPIWLHSGYILTTSDYILRFTKKFLSLHNWALQAFHHQQEIDYILATMCWPHELLIYCSRWSLI